jgi:uncharacterized membrane protein YfcA
VAEGFMAALVIATVTAPVGVYGAVFLLPVQLNVLHVPNPSVTPTNLVFNVIAGPGALFRYRRAGRLTGPLTRQLLAGTLPGVIAGAVIRVYVVPGPRIFRLIVAIVLLPLGGWLVQRSVARKPRPGCPLSPHRVLAIGTAVGVIGGTYGIGGGSIIGPILVGAGLPVAVVAPAALASTFVVSIVGVAMFALLSLTTSGSIAPAWSVGIACGLGGLIGGYVGARLQPRLPDRALRLLLGALAAVLGISHLVEAVM